MIRFSLTTTLNWSKKSQEDHECLTWVAELLRRRKNWFWVSKCSSLTFERTRIESFMLTVWQLRNISKWKFFILQVGDGGHFGILGVMCGQNLKIYNPGHIIPKRRPWSGDSQGDLAPNKGYLGSFWVTILRFSNPVEAFGPLIMKNCFRGHPSSSYPKTACILGHLGSKSKDFQTRTNYRAKWRFWSRDCCNRV